MASRDLPADARAFLIWHARVQFVILQPVRPTGFPIERRSGARSGPALRITAGLLALAVLLVTVPSAASGHAAERHEESPPLCASCGRPIEGDFVETEGRTYHPEHFVCGYCERQLGNGRYLIHGGKNYHPDCYEQHVALRCALCGGIIEGEHIRDHWDNAYHSSHQRDAEQCDYCRRFISEALTGGGWRYDDGRVICGLCARSAVKDRSEAEDLLVEVAGHLRRAGVRVDPTPIRLHLVGLKEMRDLAEASSHDLRGYTHYVQHVASSGGSAESIATVYLLHGMPRIDAIATIAHELMHVWLLSEDRKVGDAAFREGSCNYAAHLVLNEYPGPETDFLVKKMMQSRDPAYGEGFRRVKRYAEERGVAEWIRRLRSHDDLPRGY